MQEFVFLYPESFFLLWLLPFLVAAAAVAVKKRRRIDKIYTRRYPRSRSARFFSSAAAFCAAAALPLCVTAAAGPA